MEPKKPTNKYDCLLGIVDKLSAMYRDVTDKAYHASCRGYKNTREYQYRQADALLAEIRAVREHCMSEEDDD